MNESNPFQSPQADPDQRPTWAGDYPSEFAACPRCAAVEAKVVGFTWWGGVVGPKLLSHVKCQSCGARYNGKTGRPNTRAIIVYQGVGLLIGIGLLLLILMW